MKIQGDSTNFRWNRATHLEMTMLALKNSKLDDVTKRQIARFSQMPDFNKSEIGFFNNAHFYFPNSKHKSFGKRSEVFNAFSQFKEHFQSAFNVETKDEFLKHTGYALHYLQDVALSFHTESGGILQKMIKYRLHSLFEKDKKYGATANLKSLTENYRSSNIQYSSLIDLFKSTAYFSQNKSFKVSLLNKKRWLSVQQAEFNRGVDASREFLNRMIKANEFINF